MSGRVSVFSPPRGTHVREVDRASLLSRDELARLWGVPGDTLESRIRRDTTGFMATVRLYRSFPDGQIRYWDRAEALRHHAAVDGKWPSRRGSGEVYRRRSARRGNLPDRLARSMDTVRQRGADARCAGADKDACPYAVGWARRCWIEGWQAAG